MKRVTILGATGSIGLRTLELVSSFPDEFSVAGLAARGSNVERIADLCRKYTPQAVALLDGRRARSRWPGCCRPRVPSCWPAPTAWSPLCRDVEADVVVSALVGGAGLLPTMAAIEAGRTLALANKETLVMAGSLMTAAARARGVALLPVDSEHSAVFQCLVGHNRGDVHRILLTASGGPFREWPPEKFAGITVEDALKHPTWKMGAKITIDSATLMNKGLEIIEARWLFDLSPDQVQVDRASPVDRALHGRVRGRLRDRPARRGRHGHPDPLCAHVSRAPPDPRAAPGSDPHRRADLLSARSRSSSRVCGWPGPRWSRAGRPRRS